MNSPNLTLAQSAMPQSARPTVLGLIRALIFPLSLNFWPLLLFLSQKAFVIPALFIINFGDRAYRRDVMICSVGSVVGLLVFVTQYPTPYDGRHFTGFILFIWAIPPINFAIRNHQVGLYRYLTILTIFNALFGILLLVTNVDLYGLRGLNKIVGTDGETQRVYFESSSLAAVIMLKYFRQNWLKAAILLLTSFYVIFIARSVAVAILLGVNLLYPYIARSAAPVKVIVAVIGAAMAIALYIYIPILRPDFRLSVEAKQFQLDIILNLLEDNSTGWGWGSFFPQLANDPEQPYQIELQLPMLALQLGPLPLLLIMGSIMMTFLFSTSRSIFAVARFLVYALIGFNNPWILIPSWYLTCQLLFRTDNHDR